MASTPTSASTAQKPKTKFKFETEIEPVPTLTVVRTEFILSSDGSEETYVPKETKRVIRLKSLTPNCDAERLSTAIVEKSQDFLPPAAKPAVTKTIETIKNKLAAASTEPSRSAAPTSNDRTAPTSIPDTLGSTARSDAELKGDHTNEKSSTTPIPKQLQPSNAPSQRVMRREFEHKGASKLDSADQLSDIASRTAPVSIQASRKNVKTEDRIVKDVQQSRSGSAGRTQESNETDIATTPIDISTVPRVSNKNSKAIGLSQLQSQTLEDQQRQRVIRTIREKAMRKLKSSRNDMFSSALAALKEQASPDRIDSYCSMLYEDDINIKIQASQLLLRLVQNPSTLETVLSRQEVIKALARTLSEEHRKSSQLTGIILDLFFCFSSFTQLHPLLKDLEIGAKALVVVDFELRRYKQWMGEFEQNVGLSQNQLIVNLHKQEKLLFVCFYILLNLAEDPVVEMKLASSRILNKLIPCLFRENPNPEYLDSLKLLVVTFIKRLSVVYDNQDALVRSKFIPYCCDLLSNQSIVSTPALEPLVVNALRTVLNLSFNPALRDYLTERKNLASLVYTLRCPSIAGAGVRVLYVLSMDFQEIITRDIEEDSHQPSLLVGLAQTVTELLAQTPSKTVDFELASLAVNLTAHPPLAEAMINTPHFPVILDRFRDAEDICLMKLVQNLAEYPSAKAYLSKHLYFLASVMLHSESLDARLAALSILANAAVPRARYSDLMNHFPTLEEFISINLDIGSAEDDVLLQFTMLVGTLATDPVAAKRLSGSSSLLSNLGDILRRGMDIKDSEIIQQVLFTLFRLMHHSVSRDAVCHNMALLATVCEASIWPHRVIRSYANYCLNMAVEYAGKNRNTIIDLRFNVTQQPYIRFIEGGGMDGNWQDASEDEENDYALAFDDYTDYGYDDDPYEPQPSQEFDIDETGFRLKEPARGWQT